MRVKDLDIAAASVICKALSSQRRRLDKLRSTRLRYLSPR